MLLSDFACDLPRLRGFGGGCCLVACFVACGWCGVGVICISVVLIMCLMLIVLLGLICMVFRCFASKCGV